MTQKYIYTLFLVVFFFTVSSNAQDNKQQPKIQQTTVIEGLNMYPNPVTNGKVYITTKNDSDKEVIIFDLLGKKTLQTMMNSKELNVSSLSPGVYIIKINEQNTSATRKLIIR
ncbi:T9SS type A sorting domain-containing protein [Flavobacterium crassostreae]|uniref:Secretion protein n=1 Tax=Flavobacterium crassostreae TaxID=1763534 RepID=A0A1B9E641_9FLAO|nr:T9SS type A sorting domain-containing protein [Flavobacterium crassostreae]OCB77391.1 secretion protein [Flavobacterium crassostreae]